MIRVGVVAPALALRLGLRELLQGLPDVEVAAEAASPRELLAAGEGKPTVDVLVLTTAAMIADLGEEPPPVLLLAQEDEPLNNLVQLPVWGVLPLEAAAEEMAAALRALVEGLAVGAPALLGRLYERPLRAAVEGAEEMVDPLTARERQVLQLAAEGLANKEIALALQISEHTVKYHLSALYAKLGVASRTEAIRAGTRRGWVVL